MLSHPKVILPALVVLIAILVATIGPDFFQSSSGSTSDESVDIDGVAFPAEINIAGSKQSLVGGGTRSKWGFKVYAVGIYGESKLIKTLKKKYPGGVAGSNLSSYFSESKQQKTLVLRFRRGVASKDISEALGEALADKLGEEKSADFSKFILDVVGKDRLEVGAEISISCKGHDKLKASLAGGKADTMSMKGLCPAIFAVYLGSNPVSQQAKEGFERGFADFVIS